LHSKRELKTCHPAAGYRTRPSIRRRSLKRHGRRSEKRSQGLINIYGRVVLTILRRSRSRLGAFIRKHSSLSQWSTDLRARSVHTQVAAVMVATARIAAAAQITPSYSQGGANVHVSSNSWLLRHSHLDRFSHFCNAHWCCQQTDHRHTQTSYVTSTAMAGIPRSPCDRAY